MATATADAPQVEGRQEGSRWIHVPPDPHEFSYWFKENSKLHDGMEPGDYVAGVQLISQVESVKVTKATETGTTIVDVEQLVFSPYVKIDTRVRYFWDLCANRGWLGEIEPAAIPRVRGDGVYNENLGPGFFRYPVKRAPNGHESVAHYVGCSMQMRAYEYSVRTGGKGRVIMAPPPATKVVPMLYRNGWEDPNAPLKAETGAIGRALAMGGMLVIPGAGIATAEDMQELLSRTGSGGLAEEPELPAVAEPAAPVADARELITQRLAELEGLSPEALEKVHEWARGRRLNLDNLDDDKARAVLRKVEQAIAEASEA